MQDQRANDESLPCSRFADYLQPKINAVLERWMEDVRHDPSLPKADELPKTLLKDHVPDLLHSFIEFLRSGRNDANQNAKKHGTERWGQGYSIKELIWEIHQLRAVLLREMVTFAKVESDSLTSYAAACKATDVFFDEMQVVSVAKFMEERELAQRRSDVARLRLVRSISHELRNTLNALGLSSMLLDDSGSESTDTVKLQLDQSCLQMQEVLDDLLGLSHILGPNRSLRMSFVDAPKLLEEMDAIFRPVAEAKGLRFSTSIKGDLSHLVGDEAKVRQITQIMVSNAITYTSTGSVDLSFDELDGQQWAIVVKDTGIGIAKEDREHIFSEFYRVENESPLRGSGLGLAIMTAVVDLLGGSIHLESAMDEGSQFRVVLPSQPSISDPIS
ncbi:sensor histidine kinase [Phragmitibacter flavus]|uniref:sensor histidine kinase n=1 Tax=Phragmitibacter flavus TaxID=2576071 RepID=UPI001407F77C|nr:sensor histidine kinase [Phragmitibacter flavus]